jgi:four helix bundle protein
MSYKDLNVYQRAYKVAIDFHRFLEKNGGSYSTDETNQLKGLARDIIGNIAESSSQRTPKAKRFFIFKALDCINRLLIDLDFLRDIQRLPDDYHRNFYDEYEICAKILYKLNKSILEKSKESAKEEAVAVVTA